MDGPSNDTAQGNNAIVHIEQVVHDIEISDNTMRMDSGFGNPIFISTTANEGRQRLVSHRATTGCLFLKIC